MAAAGGDLVRAAGLGVHGVGDERSPSRLPSTVSTDLSSGLNAGISFDFAAAMNAEVLQAADHPRGSASPSRARPEGLGAAPAVLDPPVADSGPAATGAKPSGQRQNNAPCDHRRRRLPRTRHAAAAASPMIGENRRRECLYQQYLVDRHAHLWRVRRRQIEPRFRWPADTTCQLPRPTTL
jgi:hypothetical protein